MASSGASAPKSELLYHYTTGEGLLGVISKKEIWASPVEYLNDAQEILYSKQYLRDALERRRASLPPAPESSGNTPERRLHRLDAMIGALDGHDHNSGLFVSCFSTARDSLSQWRAYGGYAIGFNKSALDDLCVDLPERLASEHGHVVANLSEVRYGVEPSILEEFEVLAAELDNAAGGVGPGLRGIAQLHFKGFPLLATVKHPSFAEEKEWRLLVAGAIDRAHIDFKARSLAVVPYLKIPLAAESIAEVVVGPSSEPELRKASVRELLRFHGLWPATEMPGGVEVSGSDSPARL